jgi:hypothetical protein
MKEIKCRVCKKNKKVEDSYRFRTCPICRAKEKAKRMVQRQSKKLLEEYKLDKKTLPRSLWSFSAFSESFEGLWHRKPSFEEYRKEVEKFKKAQIWDKAEQEVMQNKVKSELKRRELREFIRFDLYEPTNRVRCKKYRYMQLGLYERDLRFMDEHIFECESCQDFDYNLKHGSLINKYGQPYRSTSQEVTWQTMTDCEKFRAMLQGKLKRDAIFMQNHMCASSKCVECQKLYGKHRKNKVRGTNLWSNESEKPTSRQIVDKQQPTTETF